MTDVAYLCHNCGSIQEVEAIRQNLILDLRTAASYELSGQHRILNPRARFLRWRMTRGLAQALWPGYSRHPQLAWGHRLAPGVPAAPTDHPVLCPVATAGSDARVGNPASASTGGRLAGISVDGSTLHSPAMTMIRPASQSRKERHLVEMPESQSRITAFWNTVAPNYEIAENVAPVGTADYANWVAAVRSLLPSPPTRVLDLGTGTRFVARIAAELGHQVTAVDLSEGMLDASPARDCGLAITFAIGDAVDPPFPERTFDVIVSRSLLWTLRQPELAFRNWYKLLTPGGRMVAIYGLSAAACCEPPPDEDAKDSGQEPTFFERHYAPDVREQLTAMYLADHQPLVMAADAAGFRDVEIIPLEIVRRWETSPGSDLPYALSAIR